MLRASPAGAWSSHPSSSGYHHGPAPSSLSLCDKNGAILVNAVGTHRADTEHNCSVAPLLEELTAEGTPFDARPGLVVCKGADPVSLTQAESHVESQPPNASALWTILSTGKMCLSDAGLLS